MSKQEINLFAAKNAAEAIIENPCYYNSPYYEEIKNKAEVLMKEHHISYFDALIISYLLPRKGEIWILILNSMEYNSVR